MGVIELRHIWLVLLNNGAIYGWYKHEDEALKAAEGNILIKLPVEADLRSWEEKEYEDEWDDYY